MCVEQCLIAVVYTVPICHQGKHARCNDGNNCVTREHKLSVSAYINCVGCCVQFELD